MRNTRLLKRQESRAISTFSVIVIWGLSLCRIGFTQTEENANWWLTIYDEGLARIEQSDLAGAESQFNQILARDKDNPFGHIGLGMVADKREPGSRDALGYFEKAIRADRNCAEAYYQLGLHYNLAPNSAFEARENLQRAVRKDPQHWRAWLALGELQRGLWQQGEVYGIYKDALKENPGQPEIVQRFLNTAIWDNKVDDGIKTLSELRVRYPDRAALVYDIALLQFAAEDFDASLETLATLRKEHPFSPARINYLRARNYFQMNDLRRAHISYTSALHSIQDSVEVQEIFADLCYIMTDAEYAEFQTLAVTEAGDFFRRFWRARDPDHKTELNERVHEHYQRLAYARKHYRRFVADATENELLVERLHPYAEVNVQGGELLQQSHISQAVPAERDIDDMGLIFVRHGKPDRQVTSVDGVPSYVDVQRQRRQLSNQLANGPNRTQLSSELSAPVPKPGQGQSLLLDGYFDNLPQNVSWKYFARGDRPEMVLHFKRFGGNLGWIIEAIPYAVAEREDLDPRYRALGRESFNDSPIPADIINFSTELADIGKEASAVSVNTETSGYRFDGEPLRFPFHFCSFKGENGLNTLEFYFAISGGEAELDSTGSLNIERFLGLYDSTWHDVVSQTQRERLVTGLAPIKWRQSSFTNLERVQAPPGDYHFETQVRDLTGGKIGVYRGEYRVPDFSGEQLMLSDILVSGQIGLAKSKASKFIKGEVAYSPHMFTTFKRGDDVGLYFEIYNLLLDEENKSNFRVSCTLAQNAGSGEQSAVSNVVGFFKSLLGGKEGKVGTAYDYTGSAKDEKMFLNFKLPANVSGDCRLVVEIADISSDQTIRKEVFLTVE